MLLRIKYDIIRTINCVHSSGSIPVHRQHTQSIIIFYFHSLLSMIRTHDHNGISMYHWYAVKHTYGTQTCTFTHTNRRHTHTRSLTHLHLDWMKKNEKPLAFLVLNKCIKIIQKHPFDSPYFISFSTKTCVRSIQIYTKFMPEWIQHTICFD